jgi:Amt family ammonium transporter
VDAFFYCKEHVAALQRILLSKEIIMDLLNGSDMTFVVVSAALVMFMIPGLALFYGGMVKSKNVLSITLHSYAALILISVQWIIVGYTLAFGKDVFGFIGGLNFSFLNNVGFLPNADYAGTIPQLLFSVFQMMFAVVTAAVISGAFAERMRFPAFIIFTLLWSTFVYDPIAHWVWGNGGWLKQLGVQDFAGGLVVEINSGISGLVAAIVMGRRKKATSDPHHIPMAVLGGGILWFGWFGFNAGSALAMTGTAVNAFVTTNTAAAAGAIAFAACEWILNKKPTALGTLSGAVAGLVAITPACGFVTPHASLLIGFGGGALCFCAIVFVKAKFGYDDTLDVFGCHGVAGIWGTIATGIFSTSTVNPSAADGLIYGGFDLFRTQLIGVAACITYAAIVTFVILKVMGKFMPLRATSEEESTGLDVSLHGEKAYGIF